MASSKVISLHFDANFVPNAAVSPQAHARFHASEAAFGKHFGAVVPDILTRAGGADFRVNGAGKDGWRWP
jgi:hypothetical protein